MPVAPPARATGRWPNTWKRRRSSSGHQVAHVEAVGGGVEAGVDRDRALAQPVAERVRVGGVVEQAPGLQVVEDVGEAHGRSLSPLRPAPSSPFGPLRLAGAALAGPQ